MSHLLAPPRVPEPPFPVAFRHHRIGEESVVGLVFRGKVAADSVWRRSRVGMQHKHSRKGIGAIHQRCRPLDDLHAANSLPVDLYAMFVSPLLSLLAHAVIHDYDAVVAKAADYGFRDASSGSDLRHARHMRHGIDEIGGSCSLQGAGRKRRARDGGLLGNCLPRHSDDHRFVKGQMIEENVGRVRYCLRRRRQACHARQQRKYDFFHCEIKVCSTGC